MASELVWIYWRGSTVKTNTERKSGCTYETSVRTMTSDAISIKQKKKTTHTKKENRTGQQMKQQGLKYKFNTILPKDPCLGFSVRLCKLEKYRKLDLASITE